MCSTESLYFRLGGEPVLREFVEQLYDFMDTLPEVADVRTMHSEDLSYAKERLFMFLSGMLGGPPLYVESFGPPRLRRKHLHFAIGDKERDQWLLCAQRAVQQVEVDGHIGEELMNSLRVMANHLRNRGTLGSTPQHYNGPDRRNVK